MSILVAVIIGCALDLVFGDPQRLPHPVRLNGMVISGGERLLRRFCRGSASEYACGIALSVMTIIAAVLPACLILALLYRINAVLATAVHSFMCYQIMAVKSMKDESMKIYRELEGGDLPGAREKLSRIVSRDTGALDECGVIKSTVESVSENTSDGVIAPLIFLLIGGAPFGFFYKAVNTLDSMIGYKNETYINFGRFAARLDDAVNYIPARIAALIMIFASLICRYDAKNAVRIYRRDRRKHPSPNSGLTESVCAGALRIQIAGPNYYFGKLVEKPAIGEALKPAEKEDILKANGLMYCTFALTLIFGALIRLAAVILAGGVYV